MIRRITTIPILLAGLALGACSSVDDLAFFPIVDETFSFEDGLGEWSFGVSVAGGGAGDAAVSSQESVTGSSAARVDLSDPEGGGSIWISRGFDVLESTEYEVELDLHVGSSDDPASVPWAVVVSAGSSTAGGLSGGRDVGSTAVTVAGEVTWLPFSTDLTARSGADGRLHVLIGVVSGSPGTRSYWLDDVGVTLTQRE